MTSKPLAAIIRIQDFDLTKLPKEHRDTNVPGFRQALKDYLESDYGSAGLFAHIVVDNKIIRIDQDSEATDQSELALDLLQRGKYPKNAIVLYNLGMVYSDEGNLSGAIELLKQATQVNKDHAHAWNALTLAYLRNGNQDKAMESAMIALKLAPDDSYVLRTAGSLIAQTGDSKEAMILLEKAIKAAPNDSIALFSLAECLRANNASDDKERADQLYKRVIELSPGTQQAERSKDRRREFAYEGFRKVGELRPDAIMYCLDALQKFSTMSTQGIAGVAMETATLGQSGLDVNNPSKTYQLRTIPGEYTGLNVVCILHCAIQKVAPGNDSGFDVQAEYKAALELFDKQG